MYIFLMFSALSGVLEVGAVLMGYAVGKNVWEGLVLAAMYQVGNLLFIPERFSQKRILAVETVNVILSLACLWQRSIAISALQIFFSSLCIQALRAEQKAVCPTWLKRTFRIGGFVLAPLMAVYSHMILFVCSVLPFLVTLLEQRGRRAPDTYGKADRDKGKRCFAVMIFHQMHYFVYTYVVLLAAVSLTGSMAKGVALYALTWVVYLIPQWVVERSKINRPVEVFFVCHIGLAVVMGVMAVAFWTGSMRLGLVAWVFTGIGGGSVFCIRHLALEETYNITESENIGHFLGTAVAAAVAVVAGKRIGFVVTGLSCFFVILAVISAGVHRKRIKR